MSLQVAGGKQGRGGELHLHHSLLVCSGGELQEENQTGDRIV